MHWGHYDPEIQTLMEPIQMTNVLFDRQFRQECVDMLKQWFREHWSPEICYTGHHVGIVR